MTTFDDAQLKASYAPKVRICPRRQLVYLYCKSLYDNDLEGW